MLEFRDKGEREKFEVELKEELLKLRGEFKKFFGEEVGFAVGDAVAYKPTLYNNTRNINGL